MPGPVIALDLGGTVIKGAVIGGDGGALIRRRAPTRREADAEDITERLGTLALELREEAARLGHPPVAAGVVIPGVVDEGAGVAVFAANLGWTNLPLRDRLEARLRLPAAVGHDVRAGALAEARWGAARGCTNFLFVPVGTGIGGSLVIDGDTYPGAHSLSVELGHIMIDPGGRACGCGARGCLETISSAAAVGARYRELSGEEGVDARGVAERAGRGDGAARTVWDAAVEALAAALATVVTLLDPGLVVIGGGLAGAGPALFDPLTPSLHRRLTFQHRPEVIPAALGDEAGARGAAILAWRRVAGIGDG